MFEQALKEQLSFAFQQLSQPVYLKLRASSHPDHQDLVVFLKEIASTSPMIQVEETGLPGTSPHPYVEIWTNNGFSGISFSGIPTGHELTSFVLAILHSQHKGKLPSESLIHQIRSLKGPAKLITYVSLTCENCPDVVQSLNLVSVFNPEIQHEMRDGQYFTDEIERLGIMGVPTVVWNDQIIHSGRANLLSLVEKLTTTLGTQKTDAAHSNPPEQKHLGLYDVTVIGAGPAGASAAIYTIRKGLKTAIITDRIGGQVAETRGIENLISVPYTEGPKLSQALLEHIKHYPIDVFEPVRLEKIEPLDQKQFQLTLNTNQTLQTRLLIIATGAKWRKLNVPGEDEYLGRGVAYCPHCDGPFYKGKKVAVIGGGNSGVEAAIDLAGIVGHVTLLEFNPQLKADHILVDKLKRLPNVTIITHARTTQIVGNGTKVVGLTYEDRATQQQKELSIDGVFIQIGLIPNSQLFKDLVATNQYGEIIIDEKCRTNYPHILAAGDVTTVPYKQIIIAMGEGAKAGLTAFEELSLK